MRRRRCTKLNCRPRCSVLIAPSSNWHSNYKMKIRLNVVQFSLLTLFLQNTTTQQRGLVNVYSDRETIAKSVLNSQVWMLADCVWVSTWLHFFRLLARSWKSRRSATQRHKAVEEKGENPECAHSRRKDVECFSKNPKRKSLTDSLTRHTIDDGEADIGDEIAHARVFLSQLINTPQHSYFHYAWSEALCLTLDSHVWYDIMILRYSLSDYVRLLLAINSLITSTPYARGPQQLNA